MEKSAEEIIRTEFRNKLREDIGDGIDDIPISDLGIDSLDFFEILINLEDEFNIIIPVEELDNTVTLRSLFASL